MKWSIIPPLLSLLLASRAVAFGFSLVVPSRQVQYCRRTTSLCDHLGEGDEKKWRQTRENYYESLSQSGADKISTMSIDERAKRAMLAEAVEDNIFLLETELEELVGEDGVITPDIREECVMLAKQIKSAQQHYESLVSGGPSAMLTVMENLGKKDDEN